MGEISQILGKITSTAGKIESYFNPIGRLYTKFLVVCRVLPLIAFLDDLFEDVSLECETGQIGCNTVCENRFAPVSIYQVWCFELFLILLSVIVYSCFNLLNETYHQKMVNYYGKKLDHFSKLNHYNRQQSIQALSQVTKYQSLRFDIVREKGKERLTSVFTISGYFLMLVFRLCCEIYCIFLEATIAKHMSQNADFRYFFQLKENWKCMTNKRDGYGNVIDNTNILPIANRSVLFYRDDLNGACYQQDTSINCWIPLSRNKSLGLQFMYLMLLISVLLTFLEICLEISRASTGTIKGLGKKNSKYYQSITLGRQKTLTSQKND